MGHKVSCITGDGNLVGLVFGPDKILGNLIALLLFCCLSMRAASADEAVVFKKDLGGGVMMVGQERIMPITPREVELEEQIAKLQDELSQLQLHSKWHWGYPGTIHSLRVYCCLRLFRNGMPVEGTTIFDKEVRFEPGGKWVGISGKAASAHIPFDINSYRVYDAAISGKTIFVLMHYQGELRLASVILDDTSKVVADWNEVVLFGNRWEHREEGFLQIERAQIIPAKDKTFLFFTSIHGGYMLWEVKGDLAKMVWGLAPPLPNPGAEKP